MIRAVAVLALVPLLEAGQHPVDVSSIRRATFNTLEKRFDKQLMTTPQGDPFDLLGTTRSVYVEGFGAVLTAEVSLVVTPTITPFRQQISKADIERVWIRKVKSLPALRDTMREMLVSSANTLAMIPDKEQLVFAVRLLYLSWEKTDNLPGQIVMKGVRGDLVKNGAAAIHAEEF